MKKLFLELLEGEYRPMSNPNHDTADNWGAAIGLAFDIAGESCNRGIANILDYKAGCFGVEDIEDQWRKETIQALPDDKLLKLCTFTALTLNMLERHGMNY